MQTLAAAPLRTSLPPLRETPLLTEGRWTKPAAAAAGSPSSSSKGCIYTLRVHAPRFLSFLQGRSSLETATGDFVNSASCHRHPSLRVPCVLAKRGTRGLCGLGFLVFFFLCGDSKGGLETVLKVLVKHLRRERAPRGACAMATRPDKAITKKINDSLPLEVMPVRANKACYRELRFCWSFRFFFFFLLWMFFVQQFLTGFCTCCC